MYEKIFDKIKKRVYKVNINEKVLSYILFYIKIL